MRQYYKINTTVNVIAALNIVNTLNATNMIYDTCGNLTYKEYSRPGYKLVFKYSHDILLRVDLYSVDIKNADLNDNERVERANVLLALTLSNQS